MRSFWHTSLVEKLVVRCLDLTGLNRRNVLTALRLLYQRELGYLPELPSSQSHALTITSTHLEP